MMSLISQASNGQCERSESGSHGSDCKMQIELFKVIWWMQDVFYKQKGQILNIMGMFRPLTNLKESRSEYTQEKLQATKRWSVIFDDKLQHDPRPDFDTVVVDVDLWQRKPTNSCFPHPVMNNNPNRPHGQSSSCCYWLFDLLTHHIKKIHMT